ncbi:MAG TPA: hypothetical protein VFW44_14350 [Bryobacteraceae bacterium]|nr:hypothetical protein [Bryobacteraceae bacterium]
MIEDATIYRTKEQVLYDLSKALPFSPESLEANRKGRLSKDQVKHLYGRVLKPAVLTVLFLIGPFAVWTWMTAQRVQLAFMDALPILLHELTHMQELTDAHGSRGAMMVLASFVGSLGVAAFLGFRIPLGLYFDLLDRKVDTQEGRVTAREETTNRPNGRDPIEKYFFSLRYLNMPVNLAAYRALENGSIYLVYLTHRSQILVSIEPRMDDGVTSSSSTQS